MKTLNIFVFLCKTGRVIWSLRFFEPSPLRKMSSVPTFRIFVHSFPKFQLPPFVLDMFEGIILSPLDVDGSRPRSPYLVLHRRFSRLGGPCK